MLVRNGLFNGMVLQRTKDDICDVVIDGVSDCDGELFVQVVKSGKSLRGFTRLKIGASRKGKFKAHLKGLKVGGPYDITLKIKDNRGKICEQLEVKDVLVGDVWMLAGQSNMQGIGIIRRPLKPNNSVRAFYMNDEWGVALDSLHNIRNAVDPVHAKLLGIEQKSQSDLSGLPREEIIGSHTRGPGVMFGQEMEKITGVPQGLIACAHGDTSMRQWSPCKKNLYGASLYGATFRRFRKNGSRVKGILWYQGCSEKSRQEVRRYTREMKKLLSAFRQDMNNPKLPFIMVQISRTASVTWPKKEIWMSIREQQRLFGLQTNRCFTVPAIDLDIDDGIHIGGEGQLRLGKRLALAACAMLKIDKAIKPPLEFDNIKIKKSQTDYHQIEITVKNVMGSLIAKGRPNGFELVDTNSNLIGGIYKIEIHSPNKLILFTTIADIDDLKKLFLVYGFGLNPYCNITDTADRSLPACGPLRLNG